ncbi:hydrogenase nickel incorporation protein HypB [Cryobacterium melibiosiphilum]|uniref:hydrogenase nickel incorporation protein HypB n=1 Tax=Cryobacterium melibiosiphilum TaxID=995039 RepID=UPI001F25C4DA|nr:hydrogenase nickel incorporation protein HypB [Cryobacterium melibiosiphilum]
MTGLTLIANPAHDPHSHPHDHPHSHPHGHDSDVHPTETVLFEQSLLAHNDLLAARNRGWLEGRGIRALNVMSSPGSGKTTLLVRTLTECALTEFALTASGGRMPFAVVEGDQETSIDADRIRATGVPVVQVNTGAGCHLDADMLRHALDTLDPDPGCTVLIENVGNLVCPALFDLGEAAKVVIVSVTEGDDKPRKYPHMFAAADLVVINKSDLLPYVEFDVERCASQARQLNPNVDVLVVSATTGAGLDGWYHWLTRPSGAIRGDATRGEANPGDTDAHYYTHY